MLLKLCLDATFLQFRGNYYRQVYGTAMGSPVSVVVADLVMEEVERRALTSFTDAPRIWKRYVDDTFAVIKPNLIQSFHDHLNSIVSSIMFTYELEDDNCLPFLDVLVRKDSDGNLSTSVYRKRTHTDQYLNFQSHHPLCHKSAVASTLFTRADRLSSSLVDRMAEQERVTRSLRKNGYPTCFINRCHHRTKRSITDIQTTPDQDKPTATIFLPYIQGLSDTIKRILFNDVGIKTIFRSATSLRQILSHPKDPIPDLSKSGVVYRIPCMDCEASYVGQTLRNLDQRLKEHKRAVITGDTSSSALAEHSWSVHHRVDWDHTYILCQHQHWSQRCLLESWYINLLPNLVNREPGTLPSPYLSLQMRPHPTQPHPTDITDSCQE